MLIDDDSSRCLSLRTRHPSSLTMLHCKALIERNGGYSNDKAIQAALPSAIAREQ